jgi:cytochrome c biogenesis protein CcmG, thiol:disulfide interchange protein DsbE
VSDRRNRCRFAVTLGLLIGAGTLASSSDAPAPGMPAPPFSTHRLDGGTVALESFRGRVVLLNFWALECPPCRIEMPELEKIHRRYSGRGLSVVGVTEMDPARDAVARFVAATGVTYPILLDPGARIGALYRIEAHPTSVVIDARGIVRFVNVGYLKGEEKEIERAVREALAAAGGPSEALRGAHGERP